MGELVLEGVDFAEVSGLRAEMPETPGGGILHLRRAPQAAPDAGGRSALEEQAPLGVAEQQEATLPTCCAPMVFARGKSRTKKPTS